MRTTLGKVQDKQFDYIIIGGGTSGCLLASRLAGDATLENGVLLVEAGGDIEDDLDNLIPGLTKTKFGSESGNWLYSTVPQKELNGRIIPYPRGLGMGGCSANNFLAWVRGPKADFDEWAEIVGDPWWRWDSVLLVMNEMEDFKPQCPPGMEKYAKPTPGAHGQGGAFGVGYGQSWQPVVKHCLLAGEEAGHPINTDHNDGHPEGVSVAQFNVDNGVRTTSATAYVDSRSRSKINNLSIVTRTICAKVLFEGKKAIGVELFPSTKGESDIPRVVRATKEVILSAGSFETPHILLLSGIGPANQLAALDIPLVHHLPAVGQNLRDHTAVTCEFTIDPSIAGHNQLLNDPVALQAAHDEYRVSHTGPLAMFGASASIIFARLPALFASQEFSNLPEHTQRFLQHQNRPSTEIWMHSGPQFYLGPLAADASVLVLEMLCQNNLSRGTVTLASKDPRALPIIDPRYLTSPYDLRVAIETLKHVLRLTDTRAFSSIITSILHAPRSLSDPGQLASPDDEATLTAFVREHLTMGFHCMSSCVMGREEEANKVVGRDFRVVGVRGLRVADMSVCPLLTTNHTQVNAYLIGERCAEVVLEERKRERERNNGMGRMGVRL